MRARFAVIFLTAFFVVFLSFFAYAEEPQKKEGSREPQPTTSQQGRPSLAETLEWLKGKLSVNSVDYTEEKTGKTYSVLRFGKSRRYEPVLFEGFTCDLKEIVRSDFIWPGDSHWTDDSVTVYSIPLKEINPASIKVEECYKRSGWKRDGGCFEVTMHATNEQNTITMRIISLTETKKGSETHREGVTTQREPPPEEKIHSLSLFFPSMEMANRVAKAFVHAVRLSGAKEEPF